MKRAFIFARVKILIYQNDIQNKHPKNIFSSCRSFNQFDLSIKHGSSIHTFQYSISGMLLWMVPLWFKPKSWYKDTSSSSETSKNPFTVLLIIFHCWLIGLNISNQIHQYMHTNVTQLYFIINYLSYDYYYSCYINQPAI